MQCPAFYIDVRPRCVKAHSRNSLIVTVIISIAIINCDACFYIVRAIGLIRHMTYQTARILRGDDSRCSAAAAVDYLGLSQISSYAAGNTFVFRSSGDVSCVGAVLYRAGTGSAGYTAGRIYAGYISVVYRL